MPIGIKKTHDREEYMKIGIIGPTKVDTFCRLKNIMKDAYLQYVSYVAESLAKTSHEIFLVPDKGSCAEHFALAYQNAGGKRLNVLAPLQDKEFGHDWLNLQIANHVVDTKTWRSTPEELARITETLVCFGLGVGSMIEICYTRWYNVHSVYLLSEFVPRLPTEVGHKLHLVYVTTQEVVQRLTSSPVMPQV